MAMNRLGGQLLCRNGFGPTRFGIARNLDLDPIQDIAFRDLEMSMQKMDAEGIMGVVANKKLAQVLERGVRYLWLLLRLGKTIRNVPGVCKVLSRWASDEDRGCPRLQEFEQ